MKNQLVSKKILVGMSGGVDSSMTALLLKEQGYEVTGATLSLPRWRQPGENQAIENVKSVCKKLRIQHVVLDAYAPFKERVIDYFLSEYAHGRTPNPCVVCNRYVKFKTLFDFAKKQGIQYVATGHYARVRKNDRTGKAELLRGKDSLKDQSYFLSFLPQAYLKQLVLPLGEHTKKEVYEIAEKHGFKKFKTEISQSQDFCYISGHTTEEYLSEELTSKPGDIVDAKGNKLGEHRGLAYYTIGQRRRIELGGGPYFVKWLDKKNNRLIVTKHEDELASKTATLSPYNVISGEAITSPIQLEAQIRYKAKPVRVTIAEKDEKLKIIFEKPVYALTPGQVCALYQGELCLGGGIIKQHGKPSVARSFACCLLKPR